MVDHVWRRIAEFDVSPRNDDRLELCSTVALWGSPRTERMGPMKRSKFSEDQVAYALHQAQSGTAVGDVCRQVSISEATFYAWKKKSAHLGVSELWRLRQIEEEHTRLKRLPSPRQGLRRDRSQTAPQQPNNRLLSAR